MFVPLETDEFMLRCSQGLDKVWTVFRAIYVPYSAKIACMCPNNMKLKQYFFQCWRGVKIGQLGAWWKVFQSQILKNV